LAQVPVGSDPPARTGVQVPTLPGTAHDMQVATQALVQHTPPWPQNPAWHSSPSAQGAPRGLSPHEPALHTAGAAQSASATQLGLQAAAPQR